MGDMGPPIRRNRTSRGYGSRLSAGLTNFLLRPTISPDGERLIFERDEVGIFPVPYGLPLFQAELPLVSTL